MSDLVRLDPRKPGKIIAVPKLLKSNTVGDDLKAVPRPIQCAPTASIVESIDAAAAALPVAAAANQGAADLLTRERDMEVLLK